METADFEVRQLLKAYRKRPVLDVPPYRAGRQLCPANRTTASEK